jgi:hypothetical protein
MGGREKRRWGGTRRKKEKQGGTRRNKEEQEKQGGTRRNERIRRNAEEKEQRGVGSWEGRGSNEAKRGGRAREKLELTPK